MTKWASRAVVTVVVGWVAAAAAGLLVAYIEAKTEP